MVTFESVRRLALALPDVEEATSYGTPALKRRGKLFIRLREDGDSLVVRMLQEQRAEMIAAEPAVYHLTDHYLDYPWILVRLSKVHPDAMRDLVKMAWALVAPTKRPAAKRQSKRRSK